MKISSARLQELGLPAPEAAELAERTNNLLDQYGPAECWRQVAESVLTDKDHPFEMHRYVHDALFEDWDESVSPKPA